jgi:hypothetical protein
MDAVELQKELERGQPAAAVIHGVEVSDLDAQWSLKLHDDVVRASNGHGSRHARDGSRHARVSLEGR